MPTRRPSSVRNDSLRRLVLELAAQGVFLAVALGAVLAFGLPEQKTAPGAFVVLILVVVMAVPALYGAFVIARTLRRRR